MKLDPIIAVSDVPKASNWYQSVFDCKSIHGGEEFDVLVNEREEVLICLHKWDHHDHPTMKNPEISPGNGLILYLRTEKLEQIRRNLKDLHYALEEDIHLNPNSGKREFSFRDPDGYYLIVSEDHDFA